MDKKGIFTVIVTVVVCACAFAILCVTDVITFNKKDNNVNNENNNNSNVTNKNNISNYINAKDELICKTTQELDENKYNFGLYSDGSNYYILADVDENYFTTIKNAEPKDKVCEALKNNKITRSLISSDNSYNYYLYTLPVNDLGDTSLVMSENKTDKSFKSLLEVGYNEEYGIVPFDIHENYSENDIQAHHYYEVSNGTLLQYKEEILQGEEGLLNDKDNSIVHVYKYEFKDGKYTKSLISEKYYCVAGCKA